MPHQPLDLAVIIGSTRRGRLGGTVGRWFAGQVESRDDLVGDVIDLAEVGLPARYPTEPGAAGRELIARIERADAYVVVTPEYNHGYPASLKQAVDIPRHEWQAKPVGFVSYGGRAGGARAVEQLRQVFAELHTVTVRDSVGLRDVRQMFDAEGRLREPAGPEAAAKRMLDQIVWWGETLRAARAERPYRP